jgi:hypothetical protein
MNERRDETMGETTMKDEGTRDEVGSEPVSAHRSSLPPAGSDSTTQPGWSPEQLETANRTPESEEHPEPGEIRGGYRGGAGPDWNKGQMQFDEQERIPPSRMKESELGPWGSADQAEREQAEREAEDRA